MKKRLGSLVLFLAIGSFVFLQDSVASAVTQTGTAAEEDNQETESPKQVLRQRTVEHTLHIGKIDFFGYGNLSPAKIREALPILQGESISEDAWHLARPEIDEVIKRLTGAGPTDVAAVCCDDHGAAMIYIGIAGASSKPLVLNPTPHGSARLPAHALVLEQRFGEAVANAVQEGKAGEDDSNGYALSVEPRLRASQLAVRKFTLQHSTLVREVLQSSEAAEHRRSPGELQESAHHPRHFLVRTGKRAVSMATSSGDQESWYSRPCSHAVFCSVQSAIVPGVVDAQVAFSPGHCHEEN